MRKVGAILAAAAAVLMLAVPASTSAASAQVNPDTQDYICLADSPSPCIATNGTGKQVDVSTIGSREVNFGVNAASVCNGNDQVTSNCPFTLGSGLNAFEDGNFIYTFNNGGNCLFATDVTDHEAVMDPCESGDPYQEWVTYLQSDGNIFLVNVGYSDAEYAINGTKDYPYGLGTHCSGSGCTVSMDPDFASGNFVSWDLNA